MTSYRRNGYKKSTFTNFLYKFFVIMVILTIIGVIVWDGYKYNTDTYSIGGHVYKNLKNFDKEIEAKDNAKTVFNNRDRDQEIERFQRPSKKSALDLKYKFKVPRRDVESVYIPEGYPNKYNSSIDVIQAYYSILKNASNTIGYTGGCGTIGLSRVPYPYAYYLLSDETKVDMTKEEFKDSFAGIGHITLLNLHEAYHPKKSPRSEKYYMVEIETIQGMPLSGVEIKQGTSTYFAYYYGIITTKYEKNEGWKIKSVKYIPEDFLCIPYHFWSWEGRTLVEIVYGDWYKLVDRINKVEQKDSLVSIYASGKGKKYKFDFVRLTNGRDLLVHEYIQEGGKWKETDLLKEGDKGYKLSIESYI